MLNKIQYVKYLISSYFYRLYRAIKVKKPGIKQQTKPVTIFAAFEINDTIITKIEMATSNTLGFTPSFFWIKKRF
jgi:hypothetical protein